MAQQTSPSELPINLGTRPDWNTRLGFPQIHNLFVGESERLYPTPGLVALSPTLNVRALHYSTFNGGTYLVVTDGAIYRMTLAGNITKIATIMNSRKAVQIAENDQHQAVIVDGRRGYVYSFQTSGFVTLGSGNGFNIESPISVVMINTIAIVFDYDTNSWITSLPNNALSFPALATVPAIQSELVQGISLATIKNNLYIIGTQGIERWIPSMSNNTYLFPFSRDENFRIDIGALNTGSVTRGISKDGEALVFFLSSSYTYMVLTPGGTKEIGNTGIAKIISQYPDVEDAVSAFYIYRGNYFYASTFLQTGICWVYNVNTNTFGLGDDLITAGVHGKQVVGTPDGVFNLSLIPSYKRRILQLPRIINYKGIQPFRNLLSGVEVKMVQGFLQTVAQQSLELKISLDSESWLNTVPRPIGKTGERNAVVTWSMNIAAYEFTPHIMYHGDLDFIIERVTATIR